MLAGLGPGHDPDGRTVFVGGLHAGEHRLANEDPLPARVVGDAAGGRLGDDAGPDQIGAVGDEDVDQSLAVVFGVVADRTNVAVGDVQTTPSRL